MPRRPAIDFWFSIGSTYTYLSVMRADALARQHGLDLAWRPFSVRQLITEIGNVPFRGKPAKMAYMWRDIERRAARHGIEVRVPAPYPLAELDFANRVAVLGEREGWCEDYVRATFRRWFQHGLEPGVEPNLSQSIAECGQYPQRVVTLARGDDVGRAYDGNTARARNLGLFGAPSFVVGDELFWGDDRLEDAIEWATHGKLLAPGQA